MSCSLDGRRDEFPIEGIESLQLSQLSGHEALGDVVKRGRDLVYGKALLASLSLFECLLALAAGVQC